MKAILITADQCMRMIDVAPGTEHVTLPVFREFFPGDVSHLKSLIMPTRTYRLVGDIPVFVEEVD